jgi:short-subunit dehydrogenase
VVLLTGASRGLGATIAPTLAARGAKLALVARDAAALERTRAACGSALVIPGDVTARADLERVVARVEEELGPIDVLVNNAGVESVCAFDGLDPDEMKRVIDVNLVGPMLLARLVLPGMLARKRGHVVNVASLAGLSAAAYNETYVATKHAMVGFTRALRATARASSSGVSASAVCPGFVRDAGMFADQVASHGVAAPAFLGTSTPQQVADAVVRAVERDLPEVIVNPGPTRTLIAISLLFPRFAEWLSNALGTHEAMRKVAGR